MMKCLTAVRYLLKLETASLATVVPSASIRSLDTQKSVTSSPIWSNFCQLNHHPFECGSLSTPLRRLLVCFVETNQSMISPAFLRLDMAYFLAYFSPTVASFRFLISCKSAIPCCSSATSSCFRLRVFVFVFLGGWGGVLLLLLLLLLLAAHFLVVYTCPNTYVCVIRAIFSSSLEFAFSRVTNMYNLNVSQIHIKAFIKTNMLF